MSVAALAVNRRITKWFIDDDPYDIVLHPRIKVSKPGGGYEFVDGEPLPTQRVKLVYKGGASSFGGAEGVQVTSDGEEFRYDFTIIAEWDANIPIGSWWEDDKGQRWEVKSLIPYNGYEVRASCSAYGKAVDGG